MKKIKLKKFKIAMVLIVMELNCNAFILRNKSKINIYIKDIDIQLYKAVIENSLALSFKF